MVDLVLIKFVGGVVSGISGLILFGLSSTYKVSFGKLGTFGLLLYLLISSVMLCLICLFKRVEVPERFRGAVPSVIFVVICLICVLLDKLVPGKSDALSITSYALFSILSLCTSRRSELGFETGFFSFFLSLFVQQLCKANWKLSPIALVFCLVVLVLRHRSELLPIPNGDDRRSEEEEGIPLNPTPEIDDIEVGGQGLSPMDNEPDNPNQAVSEGIILDGNNIHNNGEVDGTSSSLAAISWFHHRGNNRDTIQNGRMHSSPPRQIPRRRRRTWRMIDASVNILSRAAFWTHALAVAPTRPLFLVCFFFFF